MTALKNSEALLNGCDFCNYVAMGELSINQIDMFFLDSSYKQIAKKNQSLRLNLFPVVHLF